MTGPAINKAAAGTKPGEDRRDSGDERATACSAGQERRLPSDDHRAAPSQGLLTPAAALLAAEHSYRGLTTHTVYHSSARQDERHRGK
jgi:hypothetical protein